MDLISSLSKFWLPFFFFFPEMDKLILQFIWKLKGFRIAKAILKKNKSRAHTSQFSTYYKATVVKTVWYWHRDCQRVSGIKCSLETNHLSMVSFWQVFQDPSMGERIVFQQMVLEQLDTHMQKNEVRPCVSYHMQKLTQHGSKIWM